VGGRAAGSACRRGGKAYAKTVVAADFEAPGDADVIEKVRADLEQKGVAVTEGGIARGTRARRRRSPPAANWILDELGMPATTRL
jgi:hypothetical protein